MTPTARQPARLNARVSVRRSLLDELVVAPLAVDPDPRLQGGVRQPAEAAEGRRGEEGAARGEAGGPQLRVAPVEHGVDAGRERRVLDRDPAVALDEHERTSLPRRPVSSRLPGVAPKRSWAISRANAARSARPARTACTSSTARAAALEEATGAPATRRTTQTTPSTAAARSAQSRWPAATRVTRSSARTGMARSARTSTAAGGDDEVGASTCRSRRAASRCRSPGSSSRRGA